MARGLGHGREGRFLVMALAAYSLVRDYDAGFPLGGIEWLYVTATGAQVEFFSGKVQDV